MSTETNKIPVDLVEDGLLWLINKSTFHPRGFALAECTAEDGTITFELWGNGDETWSYAPSVDEDEKFRAVEDALDRVREPASKIAPLPPLLDADDDTPWEKIK